MIYIDKTAKVTKTYWINLVPNIAPLSAGKWREVQLDASIDYLRTVNWQQIPHILFCEDHHVVLVSATSPHGEKV